MTLHFSRRLMVALLVALILALLFKASFDRDSLEGYVFPSIVAGSVLALGLLSLVREAFDLCLDDFQPFPLMRQLPAMVMMFAGALMIETAGMYTSAFLVLLLISFWYSPVTHSGRRLLNSLALAGGFTVAMYLLFSLMLQVQTPRGWFI